MKKSIHAFCFFCSAFLIVCVSVDISLNIRGYFITYPWIFHYASAVTRSFCFVFEANWLFVFRFSHIAVFVFTHTNLTEISRNLLPSLFFVSRESREKREDFFHRWIFGLTQNLTKAYIACARMYHPAESTRQSRQARAKRRAICEICEISV